MANKGSEEIPTGYIGIYMDRLSQIFTALSVTVLPVGSLILTAIKAPSGSRIGFRVAIGSGIFSVVVDAFTCREFLRIHEISAPVKLGSNAAVCHLVVVTWLSSHPPRLSLPPRSKI